LLLHASQLSKLFPEDSMVSLKLIDRIAVAAIFVTSFAVPAASFACAGGTRGEPATRLSMNDGGERRFYTTGPLGTTTCRVDVAAGGKVVADVQVLNDDVFQTISAGMPVRDVLAIIGPPSGKMRFERTKTTAWEYHYQDSWGYTADFSVIVDDAGIVVGKFRARRDT